MRRLLEEGGGGGAGAPAGGASVEWVETGTPYAVGPGLVRNGSGDPYQVFTPFLRAWREHGWPEPAATPRSLDLVELPAEARAEKLLDEALADDDLPTMPDAGEDAALRRWRHFLDDPGTLHISDRGVTCALNLRSHHPQLIDAGYADLKTPIPWWNNRSLQFTFPPR